ncbi:hypothetical protein ACFQO7_17930 [Catellatospora aurea]|uniref:Uncharacterized protein n=1 Tax=Catellatospora aurea TaxID=1337874 RepID=A0ABW2GZ33_9ACTN
MTARRNFKKLVQERMDRTGESHTTAARLLAGPVVTATGQHRESVLVGRLLAAAGRPLSEAMVCGLGGGIGFMHAVFRRGLHRRLDVPPPGPPPAPHDLSRTRAAAPKHPARTCGPPSAMRCGPRSRT